MNPPELKIDLALSQLKVPLSGYVQLDVTVQGPAPLQLDLPKQWLAQESQLAWRVVPIQPQPIQSLSDGSELFVQSFQVWPYQVGKAVPLQMAPWQVRYADRTDWQTIPWPEKTLEVTTIITEASPEKALPVTPFEPWPEAKEISLADRLVLVGVLACLCGLVIGFFSWRKRRRQPVVVPLTLPQLWQQLQQQHQNAAIPLRSVLDQLEALLQQTLQDQPTTELASILQQVSLARFAPELPAASQVLDWIEAGRQASMSGSLLQAE